MHQAIGWIVVIHRIGRELVTKEDTEPLDHGVQGLGDREAFVLDLLPLHRSL